MKKLSKLPYLLSDEEEQKIKMFIEENETPLWKYWEEFITTSIENGKSLVFLSGVYNVMRTVILNTRLTSIESFEDINFLFEEMTDIKRYRNWSPITYNTYRKNLNSYFLHLVRLKHISDNPIKRIQKVKEFDKSQPIITPAHIKELFIILEKGKRMQDLRDHLYFKLSTITGARPIELLNLNILSVSYDRNEIRISGAKQNTKERIYEITEIKDCLVEYIKSVSGLGRSNELNEYLFLSASAIGKRWTTNGVNKLYQRLFKKTNFKVNTYMIRRFAATTLHKQGLSQVEIMAFLGHTRWPTTLKYIQNSSDFTKKATNIMGSIFSS